MKAGGKGWERQKSTPSFLHMMSLRMSPVLFLNFRLMTTEKTLVIGYVKTEEVITNLNKVS